MMVHIKDGLKVDPKSIVNNIQNTKMYRLYRKMTIYGHLSI